MHGLAISDLFAPHYIQAVTLDVPLRTKQSNYRQAHLNTVLVIETKQQESGLR